MKKGSHVKETTANGYITAKSATGGSYELFTSIVRGIEAGIIEDIDVCDSIGVITTARNFFDSKASVGKSNNYVHYIFKSILM